MAQERKSRTWTVAVEPGEDDAEFRARVEQALVDIFPLGFYGRRGVIVAPLYEHDDQAGEYRTIGFMFEEVFMPPVRRSADGGEPEFEESLADAAAPVEPEPVEA